MDERCSSQGLMVILPPNGFQSESPSNHETSVKEPKRHLTRTTIQTASEFLQSVYNST